jgi:heme A synthase
MSQPDASARSQDGRSRADKLARVRMASLGAVAMLVLQFILGMIYNLYGTAPTPKKSIGLFSSPVLALHVVLGILLFVAGVVLLIRAVSARNGLAIWMTAIGLISILGAGLAGLGFTGSGANSASLGMSLAFALALVCYIVLLVLPSGTPAAAAPADSPPSSTT